MKLLNTIVVHLVTNYRIGEREEKVPSGFWTISITVVTDFELHSIYTNKHTIVRT